MGPVGCDLCAEPMESIVRWMYERIYDRMSQYTEWKDNTDHLVGYLDRTEHKLASGWSST